MLLALIICTVLFLFFAWLLFLKGQATVYDERFIGSGIPFMWWVFIVLVAGCLALAWVNECGAADSLMVITETPVICNTCGVTHAIFDTVKAEIVWRGKRDPWKEAITFLDVFYVYRKLPPIHRPLRSSYTNDVEEYKKKLRARSGMRKYMRPL